MRLSIILVVASSVAVFAAPHNAVRHEENVDKTWWKRSQLPVGGHENVDKTWWKRFGNRSELQVGMAENVDKTWW